MKKLIACFAFLSAAYVSVCADVVIVKEKPVIDGKLDDPCWQVAQWEKDFTPIKNAPYRTVPNATHFAVVADGNAVYVAFRVMESEMDSLRKAADSSMWGSEHVELFLSPSCNPLEFYQFAVSAPYGKRAQIFHAEGGLIHPDPYSPSWKHAVALEKDCWTLEMEIPLTAFYMTRAEDWKSEWTVNVSRDDYTKKGIFRSSWSVLDRGFLEPTRFRTMKGFPIRAEEDDVAIKKADADIKRKTATGLEGVLAVHVYSKKGGTFDFSSEYCDGKTVELKSGENVFSAVCRFAGNARYKIPLRLVRKSDGKVFERAYPVPIDYDPLRISFTKPEYRTNFYPGQDSSEIKGFVVCSLPGAVKIILEGDGIPRVEKTVGRDGAFSFDTPGFSGTAVLTAVCGEEKRVKTLRKIKPNGRRMSWIEKGNLFVDGKRVFRRQFYGAGYNSSEQYTKILLSNPDYCLTPEANLVDIQPGRLIKGSEAKEGVKDEKPSKEMFEAIDRRIEKMKDKDFAVWYLCDEPECRSISPIYLRHVYNYICEKDPYHVVEICSRDAARYIDSCDMIETHPYLNPYYNLDGTRVHNSPLNAYGRHIECVMKDNRPDKLMGNISFAFSYGYASPTSDFPTFDEYVSSIWALLCEGSKSLYPFIAGSIEKRAGLREGVKFTHSSIEELQDFLFAKRTRILKNAFAVATVWEKPSKEKMVAVVNFTGYSRRVTLSLGRGAYYEYRGKRIFRSDWGKDDVTFELRPYETIVVTDRPFKSKFKSISEIRKIVEKDEWERTNRDNQLFNRDGQLPYTDSDGKRIKMDGNLVDGILYQRSAFFRGSNPWMEISFPNEPIVFKQIKLYGNNIEKTVFKIIKGGKMSPLPELGRNMVTNEFYTCLTVDFPETAADGLKIEFNKDKAEPFELEVPYIH